MADHLEAARQVEPRGRLMGQALVLDEAVLTGRLSGLLVQVHRVEGAVFEASDLGGDQRRTVREILGTVLRPHFELLVVGGQRLQMLGPLVGRCRVVLCCSRECVIEMVFGHLKE